MSQQAVLRGEEGPRTLFEARGVAGSATYKQRKTVKTVFNEEDHKVALYVDNILVYLNNPSESFSKLMNLLDTFGRYSGYKLNLLIIII